jgi:FKBP-type peptidyl-prolyl cis-trans isomerase 2
MRVSTLLITLSTCVLLPLSATRAEEDKPIVIEAGRTVSIEYTLSLDDGTKADSNVGAEPLVYQQGEQQILPALEKELAGMGVNDSKQVELSPEQGYGAVNPALVQEVEAELVPEDARHAGVRLISEDPGGNRRLVRVQEVRDDRIVLELNHPLAGETLHFDVKILAIE